MLSKGECEPFKACVHGAALGLCALMGLYNAAAWVNRRERHLAVNAIVYGLAVAFEQRHVTHHVRACRGERNDTAVTEACECEELKAA